MPPPPPPLPLFPCFPFLLFPPSFSTSLHFFHPILLFLVFDFSLGCLFCDFRLFSYWVIPLYSCLLSISYLVDVVFRLLFLGLFCFFFLKEASRGRVLHRARPPPPLPSFFHAFPFYYSLPLFLTPFLFSTDPSISGSGFRFFCCCFLCVCVCVCVLSSVVSLIESFLSILALLVITTWSSTLCLVFRLFFLVLFVSQGGFTAESLVVVFQLVELALYPYSLCVCSVFRVLSYSPLFLLSQYFLPSLCNLSFVPPCFVCFRRRLHVTVF